LRHVNNNVLKLSAIYRNVNKPMYPSSNTFTLLKALKESQMNCEVRTSSRCDSSRCAGSVVLML
ncbi:hypothetical protein, partial [Flavonifractor plautii]|uniref:hypothetical protein n=1 Tax=Flavonifractor plautii TaxID=292800 RepID=UPI003D7CBCE7